MQTQPVSIVGALGFYGPNPGGPRSPNMVRQVRGSIIEVREIATGAVSELTAEEWWSVRQMCADTDRMIDDGDFDQVDLAARLRAMNMALDCYARVFPRVVASANEPVAGELIPSVPSVDVSLPELPQIPSHDAPAALRGTPLSLESFSIDFVDLSPLDAPGTTPLPMLDLQHADEPVQGDMHFSLPELNTGLSRHAEAV